MRTNTPIYTNREVLVGDWVLNGVITVQDNVDGGCLVSGSGEDHLGTWVISRLAMVRRVAGTSDATVINIVRWRGGGSTVLYTSPLPSIPYSSTTIYKTSDPFPPGTPLPLPAGTDLILEDRDILWLNIVGVEGGSPADLRVRLWAKREEG